MFLIWTSFCFVGTAGLSHNFNPKPTQAAFGASYSDSSQLDTVAHSDSNVARTYMMPLITGAYDMGPVPIYTLVDLAT